MASISSKGSTRLLQFVARDGKRKTIRLGKVPLKMAEAVKLRVEALNTSQIAGIPVDQETAAWLAQIGDDLHRKLAAVGLVAGRGQSTLGAFLDAYLAPRKAGKANTVANLDRARKRLVAHFGEDRDLRSISPGDADAWVLSLKNQEYANGTIGGAVKVAKQFFRAAVRLRLLPESPFQGVKAPAQTNASRQRFISPEDSRRVLDACPNAEWRLLFALLRWGGLRCPSEVLELTWEDIDWGRGRIRVHAPKTE
ncbi:MAG TPA: integrase, partial [bacterium]|nr:integrase [bacterium]